MMKTEFQRFGVFDKCKPPYLEYLFDYIPWNEELDKMMTNDRKRVAVVGYGRPQFHIRFIQLHTKNRDDYPCSWTLGSQVQKSFNVYFVHFVGELFQMTGLLSQAGITGHWDTLVEFERSLHPTHQLQRIRQPFKLNITLKDLWNYSFITAYLGLLGVALVCWVGEKMTPVISW